MKIVKISGAFGAGKTRALNLLAEKLNGQVQAACNFTDMGLSYVIRNSEASPAGHRYVFLDEVSLSHLKIIESLNDKALINVIVYCSMDSQCQEVVN